MRRRVPLGWRPGLRGAVGQVVWVTGAAAGLLTRARRFLAMSLLEPSGDRVTQSPEVHEEKPGATAPGN